MIRPEWKWYGKGVRERVQIILESDRDWENRTSLIAGKTHWGGDRKAYTGFIFFFFNGIEGLLDFR